jgi:hypothetical protein
LTVYLIWVEATRSEAFLEIASFTGEVPAQKKPGLFSSRKSSWQMGKKNLAIGWNKK